MRTAGVTGFGGQTVTVQQAGGTFFFLSTAGIGLQANQALETFLNCMPAQRCWGETIVGTAAAANKAIAELLNPNASGRVVYVYSIDVWVPVAMAITLVMDGTSLGPVGVPVNLTAGGTASVAKVGGGNQLAPTGSVVYTTPTLAANVDYSIPFPWLLSLPANHNCQLQGSVVNQAFTCNIRHIELTG